MPSFKPKSAKKIKFNKKSIVTLDNKHKEILNEFSKDEDIVLENKYEISNLKKILSEKDNIPIEDKLDLSDKITELKNNIKEFKQKKKEYLLDNSKYIFEYFENKKNISTGVNTQTSNSKSKLVNNFFKIKEKTEDDTSVIQKNNNNIVLK